MNLILPEIVATGIFDIQVRFKNMPETKNRKTTMFEIELPIEDGGISYINSEEMSITQDMIVCAKPGQIRHTKAPFKCYYIHMIINEGALYDILSDMPSFTKTEKAGQYLDIFRQMCEYYENAVEDDELLLHSLVLQLIHLLKSDCKKQETRELMKSNHFAVIEKVLSYIQEHLSEDLSLQQVADFAGFSPVHFHKVFRNATGRTLREYVEEQRIKKAAHLLLSTKMNLTQIAYECGFASQSHFSLVFKRKMKLTPRDYVRKISERYDSTAN